MGKMIPTHIDGDKLPQLTINEQKKVKPSLQLAMLPTSDS